jgi:hypothetical protein
MPLGAAAAAATGNSSSSSSSTVPDLYRLPGELEQFVLPGRAAAAVGGVGAASAAAVVENLSESSSGSIAAALPGILGYLSGGFVACYLFVVVECHLFVSY